MQERRMELRAIRGGEGMLAACNRCRRASDCMAVCPPTIMLEGVHPLCERGIQAGPSKEEAGTWFLPLVYRVPPTTLVPAWEVHQGASDDLGHAA